MEKLINEILNENLNYENFYDDYYAKCNNINYQRFLDLDNQLSIEEFINFIENNKAQIFNEI